MAAFKWFIETEEEKIKREKKEAKYLLSLQINKLQRDITCMDYEGKDVTLLKALLKDLRNEREKLNR